MFANILLNLLKAKGTRICYYEGVQYKSYDLSVASHAFHYGLEEPAFTITKEYNKRDGLLIFAKHCFIASSNVFKSQCLYMFQTFKFIVGTYVLKLKPSNL